MTDVVHKILKGVNERMGELSRRLGRFPPWSSKYDQFVTLAAYRNRTYNHLVQDDMMLFHDRYSRMFTHSAAQLIILDFGWGSAATGLITFHWAVYEGWNAHTRKYGKEPVDIEAYLTACFNADIDHMNDVLEKEY